MKHVFNFSSLNDSLRGMMLKLGLLCLILIGGKLSLQAETPGNAAENTNSQGSQQQKELLLRGLVMDKDGLPLPGAAIQVKGTKQVYIIHIRSIL